MDFQDDSKQNKLRYIDALRGYAILGVLAVHISQTDGLRLSSQLMNFLSQGQKGVQLFFLVSAYTLFRSINFRKNETNSVFNFYIRRFFRIAPMYYLAILFYTLYNNIPNAELGILYNLFLIHGFSIEWFNKIVPGGWSVGIEFLFYIILPFLSLKVKTSNQALCFYIIALTLKGISNLTLKNMLIGYPNTNIDYFIQFSLPNQLPIFGLGILLYFIVKDDNWSLKQFNNKAILLLLILIGFTVFYKSIFFNNNDVFGVLFFFFFLVMSRTKNKFLINEFIIYVGKISFSLYLCHFGVIYLGSSFFYYIYSGNEIIDYIVRYFFVFSFSLLISSFTFYCIENKFQILGNKLIEKISKNNGITSLN